jgi:hypothetical protein
MNKLRTCMLLVITLVIATTFSTKAEAAFEYIAQKESAHEIAEMARQMGLAETDPIIVRAKELWNEADAQFQMDRDIIAVLLYNEAGYGCVLEHMETAAMVPINRVNSPNWPNTIYDVVCQPAQYLKAYATPGSYYWNKAVTDTERFKFCQEIATRALNGQIACDSDVVYQANFTQAPYGGQVELYATYRACGNWTYFCKE